jgi:hypothetical protein
MQTTRRQPASAASMIASAAPTGGTKMHDTSAPSCLHGLLDGVEDGDLVLELLAAAAGRDAGDDLGAVGDAGLARGASRSRR